MGGNRGGGGEDADREVERVFDVPLADLLARFEQGTKLLKVCETRLKEAELKIEQLKKSKEGSVVFEKFESERAT